MSNDNKNISELYQKTKDKQPSAQLDNAIPAAAKEAVSKEQAPTLEAHQTNTVIKGPFSGAWTTTISIAAVIILSVTLVPLIGQETPRQETSKQYNAGEQVFLEQKSLEQEASQRLITIQAEQQTRSKQKAQKKEIRHLFSSPEMTSDKDLMVQNISPQPSLSSNQLKNKKSRLNKPTSISEYDSNIKLPAEQWLEKIKQLIRLGDIDSAIKEIKAFKEAHPNTEIKQSILDSVKKQDN